MPRRTFAAIALTAFPVVGLTGCTSPQNDRIELGADIMLPAFQEQAHALPEAGPSVTGLDRSNWEPMVFEIPVNGVAHPPQYAPPTYDVGTLPRQRGTQPTPESSLDLGEPDAGTEVLQVFRSQGLAALDALLIVPRLFIRPPTATNWSPRLSYERAPARVVTAPWCAECGAPCAGECAEEPALSPEPAPSPDPAGGVDPAAIPGPEAVPEPGAIEDRGPGASGG